MILEDLNHLLSALKEKCDAYQDDDTNKKILGQHIKDIEALAKNTSTKDASTKNISTKDAGTKVTSTKDTSTKNNIQLKTQTNTIGTMGDSSSKGESKPDTDPCLSYIRTNFAKIFAAVAHSDDERILFVTALGHRLRSEIICSQIIFRDMWCQFSSLLRSMYFAVAVGGDAINWLKVSEKEVDKVGVLEIPKEIDQDSKEENAVLEQYELCRGLYSKYKQQSSNLCEFTKNKKSVNESQKSQKILFDEEKRKRKMEVKSTLKDLSWHNVQLFNILKFLYRGAATSYVDGLVMAITMQKVTDDKSVESILNMIFNGYNIADPAIFLFFINKLDIVAKMVSPIIKKDIYLAVLEKMQLTPGLLGEIIDIQGFKFFLQHFKNGEQKEFLDLLLQEQKQPGLSGLTEEDFVSIWQGLPKTCHMKFLGILGKFVGQIFLSKYMCRGLKPVSQKETQALIDFLDLSRKELQLELSAPAGLEKYLLLFDLSARWIFIKQLDKHLKEGVINELLAKIYNKEGKDYLTKLLPVEGYEERVKGIEEQAIKANKAGSIKQKPQELDQLQVRENKLPDKDITIISKRRKVIIPILQLPPSRFFSSNSKDNATKMLPTSILDLHEVNVAKCPVPIEGLRGKSLTLPDMDGSCFRILYLLIATGVLQIGDEKEKGGGVDIAVTKANYKQLVEISKTMDTTNSFFLFALADESEINEKTQYTSEMRKEDYNRLSKACVAFQDIIKKIRVNPNIFEKIRCIGDILDDNLRQKRQSVPPQNDLFSLLLFKKLYELLGAEGLEILFSNHDADVIISMLMAKYPKEKFVANPQTQESVTKPQVQELIVDKVNNEYCKVASTKVRRSFTALYYLNKIGIVKTKSIREWLFDSYLPLIKCIAYERGNDGVLTIYTHAPVSLIDIVYVAMEMGLNKDVEPFLQKISRMAKDNTIGEPQAVAKVQQGLMALIDKVNKRFTEDLRSEQFFRDYHEGKERANWLHQYLDSTQGDSGITKLIWNRDLTLLGNDPIQENRIFAALGGKNKLFMVNGHTKKEIKQPLEQITVNYGVQHLSIDIMGEDEKVERLSCAVQDMKPTNDLKYKPKACVIKSDVDDKSPVAVSVLDIPMRHYVDGQSLDVEVVSPKKRKIEDTYVDKEGNNDKDSKKSKGITPQEGDESLECNERIF
jgi:hypothetical protein